MNILTSPPTTRQANLTELGEFLGWEAGLTFPNVDVMPKTVVFTGGCSVGKTALLKMAKKRGYDIIPEGLRDLSVEAQNHFRDKFLHKVHGQVIIDLAAKQHLKNLQSFGEKEELPTVVSDRGLPDFIACYRVVDTLMGPLAGRYTEELQSLLGSMFKKGLIPRLLSDLDDYKAIHEYCLSQIDELSKLAKTHRYEEVFLLRKLPNRCFEKDDIRSENPVVNGLIRFWVPRCWRQAGYKLIEVPPFTDKIEDRYNFIQKHSPLLSARQTENKTRS